jgi:outer membrane biosynthesis protein TonB
MLGTILFIDEGTGTAIVRADDGKRYRFPAADWPGDAAALTVGIRVDFDADGDQAVGPVPVSESVASALATPAAETADEGAAAMEDPVAEETPADIPVSEPAPTTADSAPKEVPAAEPEPEAAPEPAPEPTLEPAEDAPAADPSEIAPPPISAADPELDQSPPVGRPITPPAEDAVPDYVGLSQPAEPQGGGRSLLFVVGGVIILLALAALAYMMWDNAAGSGDSAELSGDAVILFAQEDVPVRNVASMTNSTVLGRIARGDRVSGTEVPGSSDPTSRWLQLDSGNRFVPMTGLGRTAPPATPDPTPLPDPNIAPVPTNDGRLDGVPLPGPTNGQPGDYSAGNPDGPGFVPNPPPVIPVPPPPPQIRPTPPPQVRPVPPQVRPRPPVAPRPPRPQLDPPRPRSPQDTPAVDTGGSRSGPRGRDPRETQPVG